MSGGVRARLARWAQALSAIPPRRALLAAVALLVVAEAAVTWRAVRIVEREGAYGGSPSFGIIATHVLRSGRFSFDGVHFTAYRPPVYPIFLAGTMEVFDGRWLPAATALQGVLTLAAGLLLVALAWRLYRDPFVALFAAAFYASDLVLQNEALSEVEMALFLIMVLAAFLALARGRPGTPALVVLSVSVALAHLTRPTGLLLLVLFGFALARARSAGGTRGLARAAAALLVPFAVIVLPWQLTLHRELGVWTPLSSTTGGANFYKGNNPDVLTLCPYIWLDEYDPWMRRALVRSGVDPTDEVAADRGYRRLAVRWIVSHPGDFARALAVKLLALHSPRPLPLGKGRIVDAPGGGVRLEDFHPTDTPAVWFETVHWILVLVGLGLFAFGAWRGVGPGVRAVAVPAAVFAALFTATHVLTHAATRYRLPLDPLFILFAGAGFAWLLRRAAKPGPAAPAGGAP